MMKKNLMVTTILISGLFIGCGSGSTNSDTSTQVGTNTQTSEEPSTVTVAATTAPALGIEVQSNYKTGDNLDVNKVNQVIQNYANQQQN